jgi:hypothetical protein
MYGKGIPILNLDARKGLGPAVSKQYALYCEMHPDATQEERKEAYAKIHAELLPHFPSYRELMNQ